MRDEGDRQADEDQKDRKGDLEVLGQTGEEDDGNQEEEAEDLERVKVELAGMRSG
jgi:hypothetical protein